MLDVLYVLLPLLWIAVVVFGRRVLGLWGFASLWSSLTAGLVGLVPGLIFLYTKVAMKGLDNPVLRSLLAPYLHDVALLVELCFTLAVALALVLYSGIWSQTLAFVPDNATEASAQELKRGRWLLLGATSSSKPLTRRFFVGTHQFRFFADGFDSVDEVVTVDRGGLNDAARRVNIRLRSTAEFVMRAFEVMPDGFHEPDNFTIPDRLTNLPAQDVALSLASPSRTPLWIEGLYLNVTRVEPLKLATFPLEGLGGDGGEPIQGYLEIEPMVGYYKAVTFKRSQLGAGIIPSVYNLRVLSPKGYCYRANPEIEWVDMSDPHRGDKFPLDNEVELEFPDIREFSSFLQGAKKLTILYDAAFCFIADRYLSGPNTPEYSALILPGGFELDILKTAALPHVTLIPEGEGNELFSLLPKGKGYTRQFFLIDGKTLLIHNRDRAGRVDLAEIVEDTELISEVEQAFNTLKNRLNSV